MVKSTIQNIEEPKTYGRKGPVVILRIIYLLIFTFTYLGFISCTSKTEYPQTIKIQQLFEKGDSFNYQFTETSTSDLVEGPKLISQKTAILSLKVPQISKDGIMDVIITKEAGSFTRRGRTFPDPDLGKQVKIKLHPDGKIETIEGNVRRIKWRELILRNFPSQEMKVGGSWKSSYPLPEELGAAGEAKRKFTILGFAKVKGFDCVKVGIVSITKMKDKKAAFSQRSDKEIFLAYKRGYLVVKARTKSIIQFGDGTGKTTIIKEITLDSIEELLH